MTGTIGSQSQKSTDSALTITDANLFAVPQSGGTMALTADNISTSDGTVLSKIHWTIQRNTDDAANGILPGVTQSSSNPLAATLALNGVGSFNVIPYYDFNGDGKYEVGEKLKVFHIAEVGVSITDSLIQSNPQNWSINDNGQTVGFSSGNFVYHDLNVNPCAQTSAVSFDTTVQLQGGGADGKLGISKINFGWLNNGVGGCAITNYPGGHTETWTINNSFPLLDTGLAGTGGSTDFLSTSTATSVNNDPTEFEITAVDSPGRGFDDVFPNTASAAANTTGTLSYACALTAFSDDFDSFYSPLTKVSWSVSFQLCKQCLDENGCKRGRFCDGAT